VKKIFFHILLFAAVFIISVIAFFPFNVAAQKAVNTLILKNKIPVSYSGLEVGLFSASLNGVGLSYNGEALDFGDINLSYSPLSLKTRKISAAVENGFAVLKAENKGNIIGAEVNLDVDRIAKIAEQSAEGRLNISISYDYTAKSGTWEAASERFAFQTPIMRISGANLKANGNITGENIMIQNFSSEGDFPITVTGQIHLNSVNAAASRLNLNGEVTLAGTPTPFTLQGVLAAPKFSLR
jgi:hypothetical protein